MPTGRHCRNYARKGKTCCHPHRYLENVPAEIEEVICKETVVYAPTVRNVCNSKITKTKECDLWGPPEITETDGIIIEIQEMKLSWPWKNSGDESSDESSEESD
jgi:hypothetical protein